jgi:hypothetical protein
VRPPGTLPSPPGDEAVGRPHAAHSPAKGTSSSGQTVKILPGPPPRHHNCSIRPSRLTGEKENFGLRWGEAPFWTHPQRYSCARTALFPSASP